MEMSVSGRSAVRSADWTALAISWRVMKLTTLPEAREIPDAALPLREEVHDDEPGRSAARQKWSGARRDPSFV
jgi:hypothetical protein